jgi:hypothetical protein
MTTVEPANAVASATAKLGSFAATGGLACFYVGAGIWRSRELFRIPSEPQWLGTVGELLLLVQGSHLAGPE